MAIIDVRDLVRRRGDVVAVGGVSFQVDPGQVFGLLGPNGAGKTSTIEVLEGLDKPDSGNVHVLGVDVALDPRSIKQRIGVQLQSTGLPRYLSVDETLDLFASFYEADRRVDLASLMDRLGLTQIRKRINSRLSGGERQRVALALALVNDPDILFLDEPSAGLDPHVRQELWAIVRGWQSGGKTVLLTTHDMYEAEALCDVVAIMHEGKIVGQGTVRQLISAEEVEQSIWIEPDGVPFEPEFAHVIPGVSRAHWEADGALIYTNDAMTTMASLLEMRRQGKVAFASIQLRSASLQDVFLSKTGRRLTS